MSTRRAAPALQSSKTPVGRLKANRRLPKPIGSPVLESIEPVIRHGRHVQTNVRKIAEHASWMAWEELPIPEMGISAGLALSAEEIIDFLLLANAINFAFTDFKSRVVFQVEYEGRNWSDAEAMSACLRRALAGGVPVLDGGYLSRVTRDVLARIFRGNIEMPLLDERAAILRSIGEVLVRKYHGRFHNFVRSAPPRLYDGGRGLLERLVSEFPRFNDFSRYRGKEIKFYKLAQLAFWTLYCTLFRSGSFPLEDAAKLTAFADYIVPVALRVMGIFEYSPALEKAIQSGRLVPRDSEEEIEIRAHTIYATALFREEINRLRPPEKHVIIPQIDARLWSHFHTTHWPHHLTRTTMY